MMVSDYDVVIVGAGVAGLAAASDLSKAGISIAIVEARNRIGGRILTLHDPPSGAPIELGPEFIHGKPVEIWDLLRASNIPMVEVEGENWCAENSGLQRCGFFEQIDEILESMDDSTTDESFLDFLARRWPNPKHDPALEKAKLHATNYVSGFNAADPALVGVHWLVDSARAEKRIEGTR
ncbi:MAG TPA: FAD-dependent oxidoreductase, partial [Candidatus Binatia bacterium]|nr:FAD-dependent oxidoreductase [Candidatus Binatia bacterium]